MAEGKGSEASLCVCRDVQGQEQEQELKRSLFWAHNDIEQKFDDEGSTGRAGRGGGNEFIFFAYVTCLPIVLHGSQCGPLWQPFSLPLSPW